MAFFSKNVLVGNPDKLFHVEAYFATAWIQSYAPLTPFQLLYSVRAYLSEYSDHLSSIIACHSKGIRGILWLLCTIY